MIYILQGSAGMYEDAHEWIVRAYNSKEQAEADRDKAYAEAGKYYEYKQQADEGYFGACETTTEDYVAYQNDLTHKRNEMLTVDPTADFDCYGPSYYVFAVELV